MHEDGTLSKGNRVVLSATGSGPITDAETGSRRTFSFNGVQRQDGTTSGNVLLINRSFGVRVHGSVNCMNVVGDVVLLTALETRRSGEVGEGGLFPGQGALFWAVRDNGEGSNDDSDEMTLVDPLFPSLAAAVCADPGAFGLTPQTFEIFAVPIEDGNIQVR